MKVHSRENWPSVPLIFVNLHFRVPDDKTSHDTSSDSWRLSLVASQRSIQSLPSSLNNSNFFRAKRPPDSDGSSSPSLRVLGRDTLMNILPGPVAWISCSRWSLIRSAAPGSGNGTRYPLARIVSHSAGINPPAPFTKNPPIPPFTKGG